MNEYMAELRDKITKLSNTAEEDYSKLSANEWRDLFFMATGAAEKAIRAHKQEIKDNWGASH